MVNSGYEVTAPWWVSGKVGRKCCCGCDKFKDGEVVKYFEIVGRYEFEQLSLGRRKYLPFIHTTAQIGGKKFASFTN